MCVQNHKTNNRKDLDTADVLRDVEKLRRVRLSGGHQPIRALTHVFRESVGKSLDHCHILRIIRIRLV